MTDISRVFRERIRVEANILAPELMQDTTAKDGTRKWLFDVGTGNAIETVFIPEFNIAEETQSEEVRLKRYRGTLCISSQAGCALECTFCSTGRQ